MAEILVEAVLLMLDEADPGPPCGAAAWNSVPRNCCSAALIAPGDVDEVADVESVDEEVEVESVDAVLLDDDTPICASAAAIAAASGLVADALLVDDESESSGD